MCGTDVRRAKGAKKAISKRKSFVKDSLPEIPQAMIDAFDRFQIEVAGAYSNCAHDAQALRVP